MGDVSACGYISSIPSEYITESELNNMSYVTQSELNNASYATTTYVVDYVNTHSGPVDLSAYVSKDELNQAGYITMGDVSACGYISSIPSEYITESELNGMSYATQTYVADYVSQHGGGSQVQSDWNETNSTYMSYILNKPDLDEFAKMIKVTQAEYDAMEQAGTLDPDTIYVITDAAPLDLSYYATYSYLEAYYATQSYVSEYVNTYAPTPDLSAYVTKDELNNAGYLTSIPSEYITESELNGMSYITQTELNNASYVTQTNLNNASYAHIQNLTYQEYLNLSQYDSYTLYVITDDPSQNLDDYATKAYVAEYVATYGGNVDLSAYVTHTELNNAGYLTSIPSDYATYDAISQMGYITSIPSEYVTESELSSMSYATQTYVVDYVSQHSGGSTVIDENIIPKKNNTYTLGNSSYIYSDLYANSHWFNSNSRIRNLSGGVQIVKNGTAIAQFKDTPELSPNSNKSAKLGASDNMWSYTYSYEFYQNGTNIEDIYTQAYVLTQNQYDGLSQSDKEKETIYIISDQNTYMNNELVTESSLDSRGFLTAANFSFDATTGTLTLNI